MGDEGGECVVCAAIVLLCLSFCEDAVRSMVGDVEKGEQEVRRRGSFRI